mgnify:CR=1 FL=1
MPNDRLEQLEAKPSKKRRLFFGFWVLILLVLIIGSIACLLFYKTGFTFSQITVNLKNNAGLLPLSSSEKDPDRLNILLLGLRGENDPNGGLLTDTMMVASIKKSTGQVALISVPRDLYVQMPASYQKEKINSSYALGKEKKYGGGGLVYSKAVISEITGLYIDWTASVNFEAFKELVEALGGIYVYLDKPFEEKIQFANEIQLSLPAGWNFLDGDKALYYVRSRYSTSDFDRMRRQQQSLIAIKEKALSLGILTNPLKIFNLLSILGKNVRTDMQMENIQELLALYPHLKTDQIKKRVFDSSPEGLLYSDQSNCIYTLLPIGGDFSNIQAACKNIFQ